MKYDVKNLNGWSISEEVFKWILENILPGSTILELGSGNGTKELVKHYNVYSIEENKKWLNVVKQTNYIFSPIKEYVEKVPHSQGWYDVDCLKNNLPLKYDLLLIDGPSGNNRFNLIYFYKIFNLLIPIILDDSERDGIKRIITLIKKEYNKKELIIKSKEKEATILI